MATQFSMLQIMNAALIAQGQDEIVSENDGSNEWRLLSRNWPLIVEAELEDGAYNFTREQRELLTRSAGKYGYEDAYVVPLTALHVRRLWTQDEAGVRSFPDWTQDGEKVYVDAASGVYVEMIVVSTEDLWSANFSRGVQCKLEAVICRAIKEEATEAREMEAMGEEYFAKARTKSSKSRSATQPYKGGQLAAARFRRG
ncbi:MAG: hypothetical protein KDE10_11080 [Rhodobacteraceae bacterium]|nr:hypothetical protein [Paracoccaceae bacterium]